MIAFFSSLFQAETAIKQYRREEQWRQVRTVTIFTIAYGVEFRRSCFNQLRGQQDAGRQGRALQAVRPPQTLTPLTPENLLRGEKDKRPLAPRWGSWQPVRAD